MMLMQCSIVVTIPRPCMPYRGPTVPEPGIIMWNLQYPDTIWQVLLGNLQLHAHTRCCITKFEPLLPQSTARETCSSRFYFTSLSWHRCDRAMHAMHCINAFVQASG